MFGCYRVELILLELEFIFFNFGIDFHTQTYRTTHFYNNTFKHKSFQSESVFTKINSPHRTTKHTLRNISCGMRELV